MVDVILPFLMLISVGAWIAWPFLGKRIASASAAPAASEPTIPEPAPEPVLVSETAVPDADGLYAAREELCPNCSRLNPATAHTCRNCGAHMLTNNILEVLREDRDPVREIGESVAMLALLLTALFIAGWMPTFVKFLLFVVVLGLAVLRFQRRMQAE